MAEGSLPDTSRIRWYMLRKGAGNPLSCIVSPGRTCMDASVADVWLFSFSPILVMAKYGFPPSVRDIMGGNNDMSKNFLARACSLSRAHATRNAGVSYKHAGRVQFLQWSARGRIRHGVCAKKAAASKWIDPDELGMAVSEPISVGNSIRMGTSSQSVRQRRLVCKLITQSGVSRRA